MARLKVINPRLPDEFYTKLAKASDKTTEIVDKALQSGGTVMEKEIRGNLQAVIGKNIKYKPSRSTGKLVESLGVTPNARPDRTGTRRNVKVGFHEEKGSKRVNAKIANVLEYGRKTADQDAKPFLKPAIRTGRKKCVESMKNTLSDELKKVLK